MPDFATSEQHRIRARPLRRPVFGRRVSTVSLAAVEQPERAGMKITRQDVKEFLMAYSACFLAVMGLIA